MNESELIKDFIRLTKTPDTTTLEVGIVHWDEGPHTPTTHWTPIRTWPEKPTPDQLEIAQKNALKNKNFFKLCKRCGDRNNIGHMHNTTTCQSCAEDHLGVVH